MGKSLDSYVTLGRSGLRVSPLCLGTMTFGNEWGWGSVSGLDQRRHRTTTMVRSANLRPTGERNVWSHSNRSEW
jgi:hypothetical protein